MEFLSIVYFYLVISSITLLIGFLDGKMGNWARWVEIWEFGRGEGHEGVGMVVFKHYLWPLLYIFIIGAHYGLVYSERVLKMKWKSYKMNALY